MFCGTLQFLSSELGVLGSGFRREDFGVWGQRDDRACYQGACAVGADGVVVAGVITSAAIS